jgi:uncharacterized protein YbaP (TraB family)
MNAFPGASLIRAAGRTVTVLLAPVLLLALAGCSDAPGEEGTGVPPSPLFYEIADADGTVEGWMLGTIHALPDGIEWRTPAIAQAEKNADLLVVEIAALDDRKALAATFTELGTTPGLPPLDRRLPADMRPKLALLLDRGGMSAKDFTTTESWAAALMLAQIDADGDPANGVDRALIRDFPAGRVRELEGIRAQLAVFDALPEPEQRDLLAAVVKEAGAGKARAAELRTAWLTGDEKTLAAAATSGMMADPELREALLVARNRRWDAAIAGLLKAPARPLIAVGSAHLVGPEGLPAMLAARGYRIRRIS